MQLLIASNELLQVAELVPAGFRSWLELALAVVLVASFALVAWGMRSVTLGGAIAGGVVAFVIYGAGGFAGFVTLVTTFGLTALSTAFGKAKKQSLVNAHDREGRKVSQIIANLAAATMCAAPLLAVDVMRPVLLAGMITALCEAAADTVSSEVGQVLGRHPVLITTLKPVPPGQNGGVSLAGTLAGIIAIILVSGTATLLHLVPAASLWTIMTFAAGGMLLDSVLGATMERPGKLGNDSVNFVSSSFAAFGTLLLAAVTQW